jgi:type II secretion system protein J
MRSSNRSILAARTARRGGFTLLELLVAMAMVAILAVSLYASIQITFRAQKRAEAAVAPARTAQLALEMIGADLTNAMSPPSSTNTALVTMVQNFEGTTGRHQFLFDHR